jgi:hypothetical protein
MLHFPAVHAASSAIPGRKQRARLAEGGVFRLEPVSAAAELPAGGPYRVPTSSARGEVPWPKIRGKASSSPVAGLRDSKRIEPSPSAF